jgi:transcriptional regulator with XRE-family HTH domain
MAASQQTVVLTGLRQRLDWYCVEQGKLTNEDLARRAGLRPRYVRDFRGGRAKHLTVDAAQGFARLLGATTDMAIAWHNEDRASEQESRQYVRTAARVSA